MGWRDHLLRLLARGMKTLQGDVFQPAVAIRVLDKIAADPELSARLDAMKQEAFRTEFLALYESELSQDEQR